MRKIYQKIRICSFSFGTHEQACGFFFYEKLLSNNGCLTGRSLRGDLKVKPGKFYRVFCCYQKQLPPLNCEKKYS